LKILFIGDVVGRPGREAVRQILPRLRSELSIDFVIANAENSAGGKGITTEVSHTLFESGVDALTGGNHTWQNKDGIKAIQENERILRPANHPTDMPIPGKGAAVFPAGCGGKVGVVNLQGRIFMTPLDCPFRAAAREIARLATETRIIIVDFHAEATSEKIAMGWYLDGKASAVIGTHTHVQTADEQILPNGTAYITDAGMTGPHDGVIGVQKQIVLENMLTRLPVRHKLAEGNIRLNAILLNIDAESGRAVSIERISKKIKASNGAV